MRPTLLFKRLVDLAKVPTYAHDTDSGMDIYSCESVTIPKFFRRTISTGIAAVIPDGYELQVRPKSGLAKNAGVVSSFGTVDNGYRGEICVTLFNHSPNDFEVKIGDKIAQLVLAKVRNALTFEIAEINTETARGTGGFGSTGR